MGSDRRDTAGAGDAAPAPRFAERIGAALAAPLTALAACDRPQAAGKTVNDLAALMALSILARFTGEVVTAGWIAATGDVGAGVSALAGVMSRALGTKLALVFAAGVAIAVLAGRRRSIGRDFDLAAAALVPLVVVEVGAALGFAAAGRAPTRPATDVLGVIGYAWTAVLVVLAVRQARRRGAETGPARAVPPRWRWAGRGAIALFAALALVHAAAIAREPGRVRPMISGDRAPAFALPAIGPDGELGAETVSLSSLRGEVVLLDFWATWCGPCRESLPALERVHDRFRDRPVEVLSINIEGPGAAAAARRMADDLGVTATLLSDGGGVSARYKATTIPHLVVVGPTGRIEQVHRGFPGAGTLARDIEAALERAGP